jgi:hypothetical protein
MKMRICYKRENEVKVYLNLNDPSRHPLSVALLQTIQQLQKLDGRVVNWKFTRLSPKQCSKLRNVGTPIVKFADDTKPIHGRDAITAAVQYWMFGTGICRNLDKNDSKWMCSEKTLQDFVDDHEDETANDPLPAPIDEFDNNAPKERSIAPTPTISNLPPSTKARRAPAADPFLEGGGHETTPPPSYNTPSSNTSAASQLKGSLDSVDIGANYGAIYG